MTTGGASETGRPPHLAHHFESSSQQVETGKLGMWIFLSTEILMFGGLFCAYSVYRANHPDIFFYGHQYLDTMLGAVNTVVLIASSLTMAWAVRCAQLGKQRGLVGFLALTLVGGAGFMGIKAVEYTHKWHTGKWVGTANMYHPAKADGSMAPPKTEADPAGAEPAGPPSGAEAASQPFAPPPDRSQVLMPSTGPSGMVALEPSPALEPKAAEHVELEDLPPAERERVHIFFQIYFMMTGLHGLHVLIGMGLLAWLLVRAARGVFGPRYYAPVDCVGLYWHLVDLIWIFLFPLLYLIH